MSTKNESLKVVIITLFSVFFLEAFFGIIRKIFVGYSYGGIWYSDYGEFIELPVCLLVILCLVKSKGKGVKKKTGKENRKKWLYVVLVIFIVITMVHRVYFLRDNVLAEYLNPLLRSVSDYGYRLDYNNLLRESAVLLLMLFIINSLAFETKEKQNKQTERYTIAAGTLFVMLAVWMFYRVFFINMHRISTGTFRLGGNMMIEQHVVLLFGYAVLAAALFKRGRILLIVGSCIVLLYDILECIALPQYAGRTILLDFTYISGYVCIIIFSVWKLLRRKKENKLKSKWWFVFTVVFLAIDLILKNLNTFMEAEFYIWDYWCMAQSLAIFFTILWVIYPDGLPFGAGFFQNKRFAEYTEGK